MNGYKLMTQNPTFPIDKANESCCRCILFKHNEANNSIQLLCNMHSHPKIYLKFDVPFKHLSDYHMQDISPKHDVDSL